MNMVTEARPGFPVWLPKSAELYLRHTEDGVPIRALARREGVHASTVLRTVRAFENRRDDPLVDEGLTVIGLARATEMQRGRPHSTGANSLIGRDCDMASIIRKPAGIVDETTFQSEARRVLRRMTEQGTFLAIAAEMDKAVIMKGAVRVAVITRDMAQALALKDWISVQKSGRVTTYEITSAGRAAVKRWQEEDAPVPQDRAFAEAQQPFAAQHREWDERSAVDREGGQRRQRYNVGESPLGVLARRRDKDGKTFLLPEDVVAGERLREDFELAQMGPRVAQNWDRFLTPGNQGNFQPEGSGGTGSAAARDRVAMALRELGPGLGDMVLRCCCFLEGLEVAEQNLGWSARSGKIVLRIALKRLSRHYLETYGRFGPKIG